MVNFGGAKSVAPPSSLKMRNCQKKLERIYLYTIAYTQIRYRIRVKEALCKYIQASTFQHNYTLYEGAVNWGKVKLLNKALPRIGSIVSKLLRWICYRFLDALASLAFKLSVSHTFSVVQSLPGMDAPPRGKTGCPAPPHEKH